jgi:hypothetical protein
MVGNGIRSGGSGRGGCRHRSFWMGCAPCIVLERRQLCRRHARATQLGVSPEQAERQDFSRDSPRDNAICRMVDASEIAFVAIFLASEKGLGCRRRAGRGKRRGGRSVFY